MYNDGLSNKRFVLIKIIFLCLFTIPSSISFQKHYLLAITKVLLAEF